MTTYSLEIRSTQNWEDVRYRAYTNSERKAEAFRKVPKIKFTDSGHGLVPSVNEHRGRKLPLIHTLADHVREHMAASPKSRWRDIAEAKKDGTTIWAAFRRDIYPGLRPGRPDLEAWNGVQVPLRHPGLADDGFDMGWNIAAQVGQGGFPDEWVAGWIPLPSPPDHPPH